MPHAKCVCLLDKNKILNTFKVYDKQILTKININNNICT